MGAPERASFLFDPGNFFVRRTTKRSLSFPYRKLTGASVRRVRHALENLVAQTPVVFLAVVLGVALLFRVAIGWTRAATSDDSSGGATSATSATSEAARPPRPQLVTASRDPIPASPATKLALPPPPAAPAPPSPVERAPSPVEAPVSRFMPPRDDTAPHTATSRRRRRARPHPDARTAEPSRILRPSPSSAKPARPSASSAKPSPIVRPHGFRQAPDPTPRFY